MKLEPGMAYNTKTLNKIFAFTSVLFLLCVFWVFLDDYLREWKAVQIKGMEIKKEFYAQKIEKKQKAINKKKLTQLNKDLQKARELVATRADVIGKLEGELNAVAGKIYKSNMVLGEYNAAITQGAYDYEHSLDLGKMVKARKYKAKLEENRHLFAVAKEESKKLAEEEKELKGKIAKLKVEETKTKKEIENIVGSIKLLKLAKSKQEINPIWALRNAPFIDYLDPTIKIHQVVANNITDDRYFQQVPKVDRCMTCHVNIADAGFEKQKNPFKTHPRLSEMVGENSPHPMKEFGCTTCHGGEGHRVHSFSAVAHTPQNDKQAMEWVAKYNWHPPHKVPQKMHKLQYTESGCIKCHSATSVVPKAKKINRGKELIAAYGCYGCHNMPGFSDFKKHAVGLEQVQGKLTKEFIKNWVWSPKSFNEHARMPTFFAQSNNSTSEFMEKNIAEVNAIADYIWDKSKKYRPIHKYSPGNKARGKKLLTEIGCVSCHQIQGIKESFVVGSKKGPYLGGLGSKLTGNWLVTWLKNPSHYYDKTIMPSFRLSNQEANDITTYLLSYRNKDFENLKFEKMNEKVRDELLIGYFSTFDTVEVAQKTLAKMSSHERNVELGKRSIGKYGCYSCHDIDGFAGKSPIGADLSTIGSKPLFQLGFGHEKIPHELDVWITHHLENPRRWDRGVAKQFKDLLLMPNFYLKNDEIEAITTTLLGYVSEHVPLAGQKNLSAHERIIEKGEKVVQKFNCKGCHQIDELGGDILAMYQDDLNEGPPRLVGQGHRMQAEWFNYFLDNVYPIRTYLDVRMPSFKFTHEEKDALVNYFLSKSKVPTFTKHVDKKLTWERGEREAAKKLFARLECASCHTAGFNRDEATAPDLRHVKKRLRPSWVKKWLANPNAILEGTAMPAFWEDGESQEPDILGGDSEKQMNALVKYVYEMGYNKYHSPSKKL